MKRLFAVTLVLALPLVAAGCSSSSAPSSSNNPIFTATLLPANEVPPVTNGESIGSGAAQITLFLTKDSSGNITAATATFVVTLAGYPANTPINAMHIHQGSSSCACPVVISGQLTPGQNVLTNGSGSISASNLPVTAALAQELLNNPAGFYFNVHSTLNPGGAGRGQLTRLQ